MAKRFTDTDKWKKPFIRGLEAKYKLLWFYILDDCDHAGFWMVDLEVAGLRCGFTYDERSVLRVFGSQVQPIKNGSVWFIRDFIDFQYGELNEKNRAHNSVLNRLNKYGIKPLTSPLEGVKEKDKEEEREKDKDKGGSGEIKLSDRIPPIESFVAFGLEKASANRLNVTETALRLKYDAWVTNGWINGHGQKITNWKTSLINTLPHIVETSKGTPIPYETPEDRQAREIMEELKRQSDNEILYGKQNGSNQLNQRT